MRKSKPILLTIFLLITIILFSPQPYINYQETGCEDNNPRVACTDFKKVINFSNSIFQKIIINQRTIKYPQYGYASDLSWVAGKIEYENIEGGCYILNFDKETHSRNDSKPPFYGLLALGKNQGHQFDLQSNSYVVLLGKLGKSQFSMACPPQNYIIEKVIKR